MNMKTAVKYQMSEFKKSLVIYYLIICVIIIFSIIAINNLNDTGNRSSFSGLEFTSIIFIFVAGLNSFKESFRMLLQNGRSRKTLFFSFVIGIIAISVIMSLLDSVIGIIAQSLSTYNSGYLQLYEQNYIGNSGNLQFYIERFLWSVFAYGFSAMGGYFITIVYYRANKALKLIISIGVPVLFSIVLPIVDSTYTNGIIFSGIIKFIGFAFWSNPYISMAAFTISFTLLGGFSYLLMKKAVVKD